VTTALGTPRTFSRNRDLNGKPIIVTRWPSADEKTTEADFAHTPLASRNAHHCVLRLLEEDYPSRADYMMDVHNPDFVDTAKAIVAECPK
jgi:hypothetical protein